MAWTDVLLVFLCTLPSVLTCVIVAHTLGKSSAPPEEAVSPTPECEPEADAEQPLPQVWADDVLAEEEVKYRKTQGAASHSFDVCTYWDEEDERQAADEMAARISRSIRSP